MDGSGFYIYQKVNFSPRFHFLWDQAGVSVIVSESEIEIAKVDLLPKSSPQMFGIVILLDLNI